MNNDRITPDDEFLRDRRLALSASVEYFGASNKPERERWVCEEFLRNLGTRFRLGEVSSSSDEPPDVLFRTASFEVKELLDPGRRRHAEYRDALVRAIRATDPKELLTDYEPKDITPSEVLDRVTELLGRISKHYALSTRVQLDLLVYVNLLEHRLKPRQMPDASRLLSYGWRSVSALIGWHSLVLFAGRDAPRFLRLREGRCWERRRT